MIEGISAVTLGAHEMPRAVRFYCALGFEVLRGNEQSSFTSFRAGMSYLAQPTERNLPDAMRSMRLETVSLSLQVSTFRVIVRKQAVSSRRNAPRP